MRPPLHAAQPPRELARASLRPAPATFLRPLASVDIPLLREQRSALRNKRLAQIGAIAGGVLALCVGGYVLLRGHASDEVAVEQAGSAVDDTRALVEPEPPPPPPPPPPVAAAPSPDAPAPRLPGKYERAFGKSLSFGDALLKAGLANDETNAVISALTGSFDFRRAQPDDTMLFERGEGGLLTRFEYRASPTVRYEAVRNEVGGFVGHQIQLTIETKRVARGGYVEGQLGDALEGMKLGRALTGVFADVLGGKVHFSTETRAGDTFRVVVDEEYVDGAFLRYGTVHALEYRGEKAGTARAFYYESKTTEGDFFDERGRALHGGWLRTPLRYDHISSGFGVRLHPILKKKIRHDGIDYAAPSGTPVRAAAAGTVRTVGPRGVNGNLISIVHPHGYETFYAHLSRFAPGLKPGSRVKQRQLIAYVGSTGRSTGPHLHFALKRNGALIDPNSQLNGPGLPLAARELPDFNARVKSLGEELGAIELERPTPVAPPPPTASDFDEDEL
ncbi:MAG TPA: M23 family metallopeptidase [Polyangiales bacterium]